MNGGMKKMNCELHVISTGKQRKETFIQIIADIHPFIDFVHIRERLWTASELIEVVHTLKDKGVPTEKILLNDRVDVAHVAYCGGVQLAYHSIDVSSVKENFPNLYVGCSVHSPQEAINKEKNGTDFLLYGHIFSTLSKPGVPPRGIKDLQQIVKAAKIPVIAIGGITPEHVPQVIQTGARGVAVLSGILLAKDPYRAAKRYRSLLNRRG